MGLDSGICPDIYHDARDGIQAYQHWYELVGHVVTCEATLSQRNVIGMAGELVAMWQDITINGVRFRQHAWVRQNYAVSRYAVQGRRYTFDALIRAYQSIDGLKAGLDRLRNLQEVDNG